MAAYLVGVGHRLNTSEVRVDQVLMDAEDVFVRWHMDMRFSAAGRQIHSQSIGMTHLRFNDSGQIVLHQDFWDGTHGFYRHLPVVGGLLEWVRKRL